MWRCHECRQPGGFVLQGATCLLPCPAKPQAGRHLSCWPCPATGSLAREAAGQVTLSMERKQGPCGAYRLKTGCTRRPSLAAAATAPPISILMPCSRGLTYLLGVIRVALTKQLGQTEAGELKQEICTCQGLRGPLMPHSGHNTICRHAVAGSA